MLPALPVALALPLAAPVLALAIRALRGLTAAPLEHDARALRDLGLAGAAWTPALTRDADAAPAHGALVTAWT